MPTANDGFGSGADIIRLLNNFRFARDRMISAQYWQSVHGDAIRLRSWTLQKPQIERREHQDNSDVHHQPLPEPVPEEQDVHADHDGYQRERVKHDGCLSSHPSFLFSLFQPMSASTAASELRFLRRVRLR